MIKINLNNGKTLSFDLNNENESKEWERLHRDANFQKQITGIGIIYNTQWYILPIPKKFKKSFFYAEIVKNRKNLSEFVGERITCHVDDIRISVLVYYGNRPKMCRFDITKVGKQRFDPSVTGGKNATRFSKENIDC